jgi:hypothetical protein
MGAEHKMTRRIQLRRDTGANWTSVDPVLSAGEIGVDLTTGQIKIGDGSGKWSELAYYSGSDVDLTEYATEEYVDNAIAAIPPGGGEVDLSGYATEEYVDDAVGAIEIPDVSNFITAEDIPSIPADVSDLTDTGNLLFDGNYTSLSNSPTIPADISDLTDTTNLLASELVSPTVPTIGGTASASEAGINYLSGELSKWAQFTEGAFTVGVWTDVQIGWTVTDNNGFTDTIALRGNFGAASFQTTVNSWPSPASGKTYVFTSPDYQLGYTDPVEITVGSNDWTFDLNGVLTLPIGATNNGRISNINGISLAVDTSFWTFDPNGALTIPGDIRSENAINIDINLSDSTLRRWRFGEDGDLTLPAGGTIAEGVVTENPTIELTPANPEVESQKLVIKGGQADNLHLHLTTGDLTETSVFLGTDEHNIRTYPDGTVIINTYDYGAETPEVKGFSFTPFGSGQMFFPDGTLQNTAWAGGQVKIFPPGTSKGSEGDKERDIAFDSNYFYYCTADYTDGIENIWKRVAWSNDTWGG